MVLACIDIGSNTMRLLVAEGQGRRLRQLRNERAFTRIGRSMEATGAIPGEKIEEAAEVAASQAATARELGAERVVAVATAAIRDAPNRSELAAAVESAGAAPLWVLSPDEEARLSFVGATWTPPEPAHGTVAVADVGGGSTELALGEPAGGVTWSASWRIGSGSLTDSQVRSDPPAAAELDAMRARVRQLLGDLRPPPAASALAVGGTATSMRRLVGPKLTPATLARALEVLSSAPVGELAARFELDPERVRLLPAGILILEELSRRLGLALQIAGGGLREGVLLELLEGQAAGD